MPMIGSSGAPDVLVIGGGAIGVACAYELSTQGAQVLLLERELDVARGCSGGSAGIISVSHDVPLANPADLLKGLRSLLKPEGPFSVRFGRQTVPWLARYVAACRASTVRRSTALLGSIAIASLKRHAELLAEGVPTGLQERGVLNAYHTEEGYAQARLTAERHRQSGLAAQVLSESEVGQFEPALSRRTVGAIYYRDEAHCDPTVFVSAVASAAKARGVLFRLGTEVLALRRRGQRVVAVETTAGMIHPREVVIAAGIWSAALLHQVGAELPLQGGKGYHVDIAPEDADLKVPTLFREASIGATPLPDRLRLCGTFQMTGFDTSVDHGRLAGLLRAAELGLGKLDHRSVIHVWRGLRPCTPDGVPAIGRTQVADNLIVAAGHGMAGLTLAPITGVLVRELATGKRMTFDAEPLSPDRFRKVLPLRRRRPSPATPLNEANNDVAAWLPDQPSAPGPVDMSHH